MSMLIILGNTKQETLANSIIAAKTKAEELFNGDVLESIFIIHSPQSYTILRKETGWTDHLASNGVGKEQFIERVIEMTADKKSIDIFIEYLEFIFKGSKEKINLIFDLTNGTTLQKNILSTVAYILDIKHQYILDIVKLRESIGDKKEIGFLTTEILGKSYIPAPDITYIDSIAYLNLTKIIRYKKKIDEYTQNYTKIDQRLSDDNFFKGNLTHSIQLKLQGDQTQDNTLYRIASSSILASIEELISLLLYKYTDASPDARMTFGPKLKKLEAKIREKTTEYLDLEFIRKFNDFLLYLRNKTVHKNQLLTDSEKFKADLAVDMSFPFITFYTNIIYPLLEKNIAIEKSREIKILSDEDTTVRLKDDAIFYYGLDGDDTGSILEQLFITSNNEKEFRTMSKSVKSAIKAITNIINDQKDSSIIFEAGDDLLFRGQFDISTLKEMKEVYYKNSGLTCSIGYGISFKEVYLALKFAKAQPGKNSIIGIEIN